MDYSNILDDLEKRIDVLNHRLDWGQVWDAAFAMEQTMNMTLERFVQENGSRQEFIDRNNNRGMKNETIENEPQISNSKAPAQDLII